MRSRCGAVLAIAILLAAPAAPMGQEETGPVADGALWTAPSAAVDAVTEKLICDCGCSNLTIRNCTCGKADRVRAEVAGRLAEGESPDQIVQAYVDEYGEQILASPTRRGFNLVGWLLPFAAVLAGATALVLVLRRWSRVPISEAPILPPLGAAPPTAPGPDILKRIEREMAGEEP